MSVPNKEIVADYPPDIIDYPSSIVNMSIFEYGSLLARKSKTVKAKDFELILKELDLMNSIASKTFWYIAEKYKGDNMDFYYRFIFDSKDVIEDRIRTIIHKNKVSQSEIYDTCKKITDEIIHDKEMMHFYYIIIGIYIIARFKETPAFVDRKKIDIASFDFKKFPLIVFNNTNKDFLGIPIDSRLVKYDKDLDSLVILEEGKDIDNLSKLVKDCKLVFPQQVQINPPINNDLYIPVPLRTMRTLDDDGEMTYYTAPRKFRRDIPENKGKVPFTFKCFPLELDDSEDELLENEPDSETDEEAAPAEDEDEEEEDNDEDEEEEDDADAEAEEDDEEDDEVDNNEVEGGEDDERFWHAVEVAAWADRSDRICSKNNIDNEVVNMINGRIGRFVDRLKRVYNNEMNDDFYKHIVLKGLDFYNEVINNSDIALYLLDNEVQVW
jgi:hypothetical protein